MLDVFLASPRAAVGLADKTTNTDIVYVFAEEYVKKVTLIWLNQTTKPEYHLTHGKLDYNPFNSRTVKVNQKLWTESLEGKWSRLHLLFYLWSKQQH